MADISDKFSSEKKTGVEAKTESTSVARMMWDISKASALYGAGYGLFGAPVAISAALGSAAYLTAHAIETSWAKKAYHWRDAYKEFIMGGVLGGATYGLFSSFSTAQPITTAGKWGKTGIFMGLSAVLAVPAYRGLVYIREKVGFLNALKGMYTGDIKQYIKDAWNHDIKKNWANIAFKGVAIMTIPYHLILNYIPSDIMKVGVQKLFAVGTRLIQGGKNLIKGYEPAPAG